MDPRTAGGRSVPSRLRAGAGAGSGAGSGASVAAGVGSAAGAAGVFFPQPATVTSSATTTTFNAQGSMTTGTIIGGRLVRSLTNLPAACSRSQRRWQAGR